MKEEPEKTRGDENKKALKKCIYKWETTVPAGGQDAIPQYTQGSPSTPGRPGTLQ